MEHIRVQTTKLRLSVSHLFVSTCSSSRKFLVAHIYCNARETVIWLNAWLCLLHRWAQSFAFVRTVFLLTFLVLSYGLIIRLAHSFLNGADFHDTAWKRAHLRNLRRRSSHRRFRGNLPSARFIGRRDVVRGKKTLLATVSQWHVYRHFKHAHRHDNSTLWSCRRCYENMSQI